MASCGAMAAALRRPRRLSAFGERRDAPASVLAIRGRSVAIRDRDGTRMCRDRRSGRCQRTVLCRLVVFYQRCADSATNELAIEESGVGDTLCTCGIFL